MTEKEILTRIQHKYDTQTNWEKATGFTPKKGELIIYSDIKKFKVGDGNSKLSALQFYDIDLSSYATKAYADQAEADALAAAKTYANGLAKNYATAAQGAKADSALQSSDIAAAAKKNVDSSISTGSTSTNLPTSAAVAGFVEGKGYTKNTGTVTSVVAGSGLQGGTITGSGRISHGDTSSQASVTASGRKYITGVTLDGYGHVTGLTTGTETVTNTNTTYDLAASKNSTNGNVQVNLTAGGSGSGTDSVTIKGSGATTVTTDANGVITVSSTDNNTTYSAATTSTAGLMSAADKTKLDGIAAGAQVNQKAFSNIVIGSTTIAADSTTDTVTFVGSNITITPDATNDKVTFSVADGSTSGKGIVQLTNSTSSTSTTTAATPSSVKSAYDRAGTAITNAATAQARADSAYSLAEGKVDSLSDLGITATAAELNYVDGVTSNIQTQLDGKAASSHNHSASNITSGTIAAARLPAASGTQAGITIVYPSTSCTTFSSDSGTVTPLAVQKGAKMFAITRPSSTTVNAVARYSNTTGDVQDSKITVENVTNTRDTSKTANVLVIPAEGNKKMVYGYCSDQVDGTSFIGGVFDASATEYPYNQGLAIGGTSGNLLWKGAKVATVSDIPSVGNGTVTIKQNGTSKGSFTLNQSGNATIELTDTDTNTTYSAATTSTAGLMSATDKKKLDGIATGANNYTYTLPNATSSVLGGVKIGSNITVSSGTISLTKSNVTSALGYTPPTTNTTYSAATQSAAGLMSAADKKKLDGIASGANKTTVDSSLSSTSTNPVQNKVINSALSGKANSTHTHAASDITSGTLPVARGGTGASTVINAWNNLGFKTLTSVGTLTRDTTNTTADYWSGTYNIARGFAYVFVNFTLSGAVSSSYTEYAVAHGLPVSVASYDRAFSLVAHDGTAIKATVDTNGTLTVYSGTINPSGWYFEGMLMYPIIDTSLFA